jgi:hypothetical protein
MATTTLGFEHQAKPWQGDIPVPTGYGDFFWSNFGVDGKKFLYNHYGTANGGAYAIVGKVVGYTYDLGAYSDGWITAEHGTFTLKQGIFASAWNYGETVTFNAYRHGVFAGALTVTLDQSPDLIKFGPQFQHIDQIEIYAHGGFDADGSDGFYGPQLAVENLKVVLDRHGSALDGHHIDPVLHDDQTAYHFGVMHSAGDWIFA